MWPTNSKIFLSGPLHKKDLPGPEGPHMITFYSPPSLPLPLLLFAFHPFPISPSPTFLFPLVFFNSIYRAFLVSRVRPDLAPGHNLLTLSLDFTIHVFFLNLS